MRSKYIKGCETWLLIPHRFNPMNKLTTFIPVSKEKKLTLYIKSNIYLVRLHRYGERHISRMHVEEE
jgi:hypothetical protein